MKIFLTVMAACCTLLPFSSRSQDFWEPIPYPNTTEPMSCFAMDGNGRLFACQQENVFYTDDMGQNWFTTSNWPGYYPDAMVVNSADVVFIETFNNGIFRSTDGGASFQEINNGLTADLTRCFVVLDNDHLLVGTSEGLFRSVNSGDLWEPYGTGLPDDWVEEISVGENGKLLAGMLNAGVYRSYDYGSTWEEATGGLPETTQVTTILTVPGTTSAYVGLYPQGLFYSSDDGDNWMEFNDGLPFKAGLADMGRDYSLHGLTKIQQFVFLYIYAHLVYVSEYYINPIGAWLACWGGMPPNTNVNAMTALIFTYIICGTMGSQDTGPAATGPGIYINAVPVDIPGPFFSEGQYQLGIMPSTEEGFLRLRISLPENEPVTLAVHNLLGQKIAETSSGVLSAGNHDLVIHTGNLEPGIYVLSMQAGKQIVARKFAR